MLGTLEEQPGEGGQREGGWGRFCRVGPRTPQARDCCNVRMQGLLPESGLFLPNGTLVALKGETQPSPQRL